MFDLNSRQFKDCQMLVQSAINELLYILKKYIYIYICKFQNFSKLKIDPQPI